jgi:hypothetical protein
MNGKPGVVAAVVAALVFLYAAGVNAQILKRPEAQPYRTAPVEEEAYDEAHEAPEMSEEAQPVEFDASLFRSDPTYEETGYDPEAQFQIYGGKTAVDGPRPLLEIGRDLYSEGPLGEGKKVFLGGKNRLFPQFLVYGDARGAIAYNDNGATELGQAAVRLNLDLDLKLTSTERIHAFIRPLDKNNQFTRHEFSGDGDDSELLLDANLETLFFEGDLGSLSAGFKDEYVSYDLPFAFGFLPLLFQNGVWMEDAFIGGALTIPAQNSPTLDISNMDFTFFAGFDKVTSDALVRNGARDDGIGNVFGVAAFIETLEGYMEAGYGYVDDTSDADFSYHNVTVAFTRRYRDILSNSVRLIANLGQDPAGGAEKTAEGAILLVENSLITHKPLTLIPYVNFWIGFDQPQSLARAGGAGGVLRNTGLNFETDGLTGFPKLDDTGHETFGGAIGVEYLFNLDQQIVVEFATVQTRGDEAKRNAAGDQYALGMRYQLPLTDRWILRADAMYGLLDNEDDIAGVRVEIRRKF